MLVPGHVVSLYVATCGHNGPLLGSDEKEIILMVYAVIDVQKNEIVGIKQYLVRPSNPFGKDNAADQNTTTSSTSSTDTSIGPEIQIPETVVQNNGRALEDVIEQFDAYTRHTLKLDPHSPNFRLVTDGQLPLRQCLHPEACAKEIQLPDYYWKFNDLRKEYTRFKGGDLSRALIPVSDLTKLHTLPSLPPAPNSIVDMLQGLELPSYEGSDYYIKEAHDMTVIIQTLIAAGHKFEANETVNLCLEPGICSIDDEIDGTCIVRARGLPWQSSDQDIAKFFRGLNVAKGGVALCLSPQGRRNGEALIRFVSQEHRDMALKRHKHHIGSRYIEVYRASGEDFLAVAGGASNEAQAFLSKGAQVIIRMRGLPYDCTAKQVLDFFANGENSCNVLDNSDGILFVKKPDGRATGDAFVLFAQESDAPKALSKHRESIGQRYIELFRSTTAEVQQVLNRSMDPKTYEPPQLPLISQIPPVQMSLVPQHVITSGTEKNCIRLRGLPYEAKVEHILHFLEDFAKHIVYQGVHLVYNAQGQFNGEAFIQLDSETAAFQSAQQKHHKNMMFGKKQRYIEVFQCSGDDMNMVLNGGFQQPSNISKPPLLSPGMLPSPQQQPPPQPPQSIPLSPILSVPPPITLSIPPPSPQMIAQQQAHFIAQQSLMARQAAAAAAAQQQNDQIILHNLSLYQNPQGASQQASALQFAHQTAQPPPMHTQNQALIQSHLAAHGQHHHPGMGPIFFPLMHRMVSPSGIPMGMMPTAGSVYPFPFATQGVYQHQAGPPHAVSQATATAVSQSPLLQTSIKRSYDNAFRNDQAALAAANAPKRQFHGTPQPGSATLYTPFYHPHL